MKNSIQPYERVLCSPPELFELPNNFRIEKKLKTDHSTERSVEVEICDDSLQEEDYLYLVRQRVENLREQIGLTFDEIVELQNLEGILRPFEKEQEYIPENLGIPDRIYQFIAALEAKRVNRYEDKMYDGGEVNDNEESVSSVNLYYQELFQKSWLNPRSILVLDQEKRLIMNGAFGRELHVFDLFQVAPPKYTFQQFLVQLWKIPKKDVMKRFGNESEANQWKIKEQWQKYLKDRKNVLPSPYQQVLIRLTELVTSPIYDEKREVKEEHYIWKEGYELRFTDKTAIFTCPLSECSDIPKFFRKGCEKAAFIQVSFLLPEFAHERKRYFRRGGTVEEFTIYLKKIGGELNDSWIGFMNRLVEYGVIRLYHEVLELPDHNEIGGFFINVVKGYKNDSQLFPKRYIEQCLQNQLKQNNKILIRIVTRFSEQYPVWMRNIGGFIVESLSDKKVVVGKPLRISVDDRLPQWKFKQEKLLMPSPKLLSVNSISREAWQNIYLGELRYSYRSSPKLFQKYAKAIESGHASMHCACNHGGKEHEEYCPVPVLMMVFRKIQNK